MNITQSRHMYPKYIHQQIKTKMAIIFMTMQQTFSRRVQYLFPVALASLLILGVTRIVLDNLKNKNGFELIRNFDNHREKENNRVNLRGGISVDEDEVMNESCDMFQGRWVWDNVSHPIYREEMCSYMVKQVACQRNGRPDSSYQNWRWQPDACNLPRFNGLKLLEILRDKRLMFVGDSVQRGMFDSMVCLLQSSIPNFINASLERIPPRKIFRIQDFNVSFEFYWAPFIVESNSDHATNHSVQRRMVRLDSIAQHSKQWQGADMLVFESYVWWMYKPLINATYGSSEDVKLYNVTTAYKMALETWSNWIKTSINPKTQKLFFVTMSPTHLWSWEWNSGSEGNCFNETKPIEKQYWGTGSNLEIMKTVKDVLKKLRKFDVKLLNITQLSELRKDGHTSVYGERRGKLLTKEERSDPINYADCIHWCLPGVPDTWNQILYAYILQDYRHSIKGG